MAMLYDITAHPLLSDETNHLSETALSAQARVAETLLGLLKFTPFSPVSQPDLYSRASDAVALQVNYQVESGIDAFILSSMSRGGRANTFRGGRRMPPIHGLAKKIVSSIRPVGSAATGR